MHFHGIALHCICGLLSGWPMNQFNFLLTPYRLFGFSQAIYLTLFTPQKCAPATKNLFCKVIWLIWASTPLSIHLQVPSFARMGGSRWLHFTPVSFVLISLAFHLWPQQTPCLSPCLQLFLHLKVASSSVERSLMYFLICIMPFCDGKAGKTSSFSWM